MVPMLCTVNWVKKKVSCGGVIDLAVEQPQLFRKLHNKQKMQITKNKMDWSNRKNTYHPPSPNIVTYTYVERMDEYHIARRVLMAEVSRGRVRRRPRLGWMDGVKVALGSRGMTVEATRQCAKDDKEWRALVHM